MLGLLTSKWMAERSDVRCGCASIALFLAFVSAPAAQTENQAGAIGLLTLPQLLGSGSHDSAQVDRYLVLAGITGRRMCDGWSAS